MPCVHTQRWRYIRRRYHVITHRGDVTSVVDTMLSHRGDVITVVDAPCPHRGDVTSVVSTMLSHKEMTSRPSSIPCYHIERWHHTRRRYNVITQRGDVTPVVDTMLSHRADVTPVVDTTCPQGHITSHPSTQVGRHPSRTPGLLGWDVVIPWRPAVSARACMCTHTHTILRLKKRKIKVHNRKVTGMAFTVKIYRCLNTYWALKRSPSNAGWDLEKAPTGIVVLWESRLFECLKVW